MADVKYQIFVSSTFRDLKDERQAALAAVLELGHFPAGMEAFPAASSTPWDLIRKIIAQSDYYILIIGGRYGSTDENGVSYTEKEYDFAIEQGIPTIVYLHADPSQIPAGNCDMNENAKRRLDDFRQKVSQKHHFKEWKTPDELKSKIVLGIIHETSAKPRVGWIKSSDRDSSETLRKLNALLEENSALKQQVAALKSNASNSITKSEERFAHDDEEVVLVFRQSNDLHEVRTTWKQIFHASAPMLTLPNRPVSIQITLARFFEFSSQKKPGGQMTPESWDKIALQFLALGYWEIVTVPKTPTAPSSGMTRSRVFSDTSPTSQFQLTSLGVSRYAESAAMLRTS